MHLSKTRSLPNAIIIGAHKCGTTSLFYYLSLHPEIGVSAQKEPGFFARDEVWGRGLDWYQSLFAGQRRIRLEASTCYTYFPEHSGVAQRIHSLLPDAKLIYLVRDPLERIISNYLQHADMGIERRNFSECLCPPGNNPYVMRSCYGLQLEQYLQFYPMRQILVVSAEDLLHDRIAALRRIFRFLEVEDSFRSIRFHLKMNRSSLKRQISASYRRPPCAQFLMGISLPFYGLLERAWKLPQSRPLERPRYTTAQCQALTQFLRNDLRRFRELTGQDFPAWSI